MIPCLNKDSLKLLVGTADERYDYSPEYFRKTHFPQVMHRYHGNELVAEITENELLENLKEIDSNGNRIYLVFGSTGSGKSELLCWLRDKWITENTGRPVIRISRSELNPQVLIKKCFDVLNIPMAVSVDENRWELLLKKPITLINQIVWAALAESMETDEEIVPAALLLRPIIEKNVTEFTIQVQRGRINKPLEVLHRDQFESLKSSTTIHMPMEYLSIRQALSRKLDQFLFEGWDIASLFNQLTNQLKARDVRPLLLIDDLVQSVNIYATDLLDQLISLEEGNWDVVIGLTPGAVQDSDKGFNLAQRIQNLDTINDRVKKLWLSDESGKDFYNLDRGQVVPYMSNYLEQLKGTKGFVCSKMCNHYQDCSSIVQTTTKTDDGMHDIDVKLLPFNRHMLKRTFDAIPLGKGKLRYMILNSKEIIRFFQRGKKDTIARMIPLVKREKFADHTDLLVKTFAEWYAPENSDETVVSRQILKHFGYLSGDTTVRLHPLGISFDETYSKVEDTIESPKQEEKATVRDWVEGKKVNSELLEPVRLGVAALVHEVVKGVNMSRSFTPRATAIIQRKDIVNRTRYPIEFDDHEKSNESIMVKRGYSALQISNFQLLKGVEKVKLFQSISGEFETASWIYQAEIVNEFWKEKLGEVLGLDIATFAYGLKTWVDKNMTYSHSAWASNIKIHSPFHSELSNIAEQCYQDWFMLRDNLYEPSDLFKFKEIDFDKWLLSYVPVKQLEQYQIHDVSLYVFISQLQESYQGYCTLLKDSLHRSIQNRMSMLNYLIFSEDEKSIEFARQIEQFNTKLDYTLQDYHDYSVLDSEMESQNIHEKFALQDSLHKEVTNLFRQFIELFREVQAYMVECGEDDLPLELTYPTNWSTLEHDKKRFVVLVDEIAKIRNCFSMSSRIAVKQVIHANTMLSDVLNVQTLWSDLMGSVRSLAKEQVGGTELMQSIAKWNAIDFHELKMRVLQVTRQEEDKRNLIKLLQVDLNCAGTDEIFKLLAIIEESEELRPAIKRQLKLLLEQGYSTLPPVQWRRLLYEMKEKFPKLFQSVEIRLVLVSDN